MYNVHLPIMLESERQAVYRERKRNKSFQEKDWPSYKQLCESIRVLPNYLDRMSTKYPQSGESHVLVDT